MSTLLSQIPLLLSSYFSSLSDRHTLEQLSGYPYKNKPTNILNQEKARKKWHFYHYLKSNNKTTLFFHILEEEKKTRKELSLNRTIKNKTNRLLKGRKSGRLAKR